MEAFAAYLERFQTLAFAAQEKGTVQIPTGVPDSFVFLLSGFFSVTQAGRPITLEDYCNFLLVIAYDERIEIRPDWPGSRTTLQSWCDALRVRSYSPEAQNAILECVMRQNQARTSRVSIIAMVDATTAPADRAASNT